MEVYTLNSCEKELFNICNYASWAHLLAHTVIVLSESCTIKGNVTWCLGVCLEVKQGSLKYNSTGIIHLHSSNY